MCTYSQIDRVIEYFAKDPLKILYFIGGTGGLLHLIDRWWYRIRVSVKILSEKPDNTNNTNPEVNIECEIENIGGQITSLKQEVVVTGYTPKKEFQRLSFEIRELERDLPPHKPKLFNAVFKVSLDYHCLLFRTYTFHITRGLSKAKRLRVWSASRRNIGFLRFYYELLRFKLFGIYEEPQT